MLPGVCGKAGSAWHRDEQCPGVGVEKAFQILWFGGHSTWQDRKNRWRGTSGKGTSDKTTGNGFTLTEGRVRGDIGNIPPC